MYTVMKKIQFIRWTVINNNNYYSLHSLLVRLLSVYKLLTSCENVEEPHTIFLPKYVLCYLQGLYNSYKI